MPNSNLSHPAFPQPSDSSVKVWRYMDIPKFLYLIQTSQLYLTRIRLFSDKFECSIPTRDADINFNKVLKKCMGFRKKDYVEAFGEQNGLERFLIDYEHLLKQCELLVENNDAIKDRHFANCWHMSEYESEAMWKLYCSNDAGIVLQTTYQKLAESIAHDESAFIGQVTYVDGVEGFVNVGNEFYQPMHKRLSFEYEREIRIIKPEIPTGMIGTPNQKLKDGLEIKIDLSKAIETIVISPYAPNFFHAVIRDFLNKIHPQLTEKLKLSQMAGNPRFNTYRPE